MNQHDALVLARQRRNSRTAGGVWQTCFAQLIQKPPLSGSKWERRGTLGHSGHLGSRRGLNVTPPTMLLNSQVGRKRSKFEVPCF